MKIYGYMRVSTTEQNTDRQREALEAYTRDYTLIVEDKKSGKNFDRPQYKYIKSIVVPGDTIVIKELDRLGRDMDAIKNEWQYFTERNINIVIIENPMLSTTNKSDLEKKLISNIVFEILSYTAQKEREKIINRINEGLKIAKEKGVKLGRPELTKDNLPKDFYKYYHQYKEKKIKAIEFRKLIGVSKASLYRFINIYEA